jgi:hypothetical protein
MNCKAAIKIQCAWRVYWAKLDAQLRRDRRDYVLHAEQATADADGRDEREAMALNEKRIANKLAREAKATAAGRDFNRELIQVSKHASDVCTSDLTHFERFVHIRLEELSI